MKYLGIIVRKALTATAITAFAVVLAGCPGGMPDTQRMPDTQPSFGIPALPDASYPVRFAISDVTLPAASGGNGDLSYSLTPIPAGLSFDPASRAVSGMPTTVGVYPMTYTAADEDDDVATLTFTVTIVHSMVFWTDFRSTAGKIWSARLDGSSAKELLAIEGEPHGVALDVPGNKMYWAEHTTGKIRRANLDGSSVEDLVTDSSANPRSIALDVSGGKMYWTDNGTSSIRRANLNGSGVENLVTGLSYPTAIALDLTDRMMYWIDDGADKIQRANLDGSGIQSVTTGDLDAPYGIAVDPVNQSLYWTHRRTGRITRANLDGTGVEDLVADASLAEPAEIALDLISEKMYWAEQGGNIRRANLDGSTIEDLVTSGVEEPYYGIALH